MEYTALTYWCRLSERIGLNMDQITRYNPPPNPAKITDSRARAYIRKYGDESWELDALSPTVVAQLIEREVNNYRDMAKWDKEAAKETEDKTLLNKTVRHWKKLKEHMETLP